MGESDATLVLFGTAVDTVGADVGYPVVSAASLAMVSSRTGIYAT